MLRQIYEPLVDVDPVRLRVLPRLASRWSASSDGRVWTFTLRTGVRFHDGTSFDASAVVFDFERARDFARFGIGTLVESVTAPDPATVVFTLREPYAPFLATLAATTFGIVSPSCARQGPAWATPSTRCAAGTGPFKLETGGWKSGARVDLVRNSAYWGADAAGRRLPLLDGVTFLPVRDENVRIGALKASNVDVVLDLAPASVRVLRADPNITAAPAPVFSTVFIGLGAGGPLGTPEVRRAVAMAVDRGAIVQAVYAGQARPAAQLVPPELLGYDDTLTQFVPTDPAAAKKLVDAAGATPLTIDIWYSPEASTALPDPKRVAASVAADLTKIGISVNVRTEDATSFAADAKAGRLPLWIGVADPGRADPDDFLAGATADPIALELLRGARGEVDGSKRGELYKQVSKLVQQSVSRIPLLHTAGLAGLSKKVRGFVPAAVGPELLENVYFGN